MQIEKNIPSEEHKKKNAKGNFQLFPIQNESVKP